jgi:hypothetical protein
MSMRWAIFSCLVRFSMPNDLWQTFWKQFWPVFFFFADQFSSALPKLFPKIIFCHKFSGFWKQKSSKIVTIAYNMKRCLIFFYFDIWNIFKFGYIFLWMIDTWATSQNWKKEKSLGYKQLIHKPNYLKNTCLFTQKLSVYLISCHLYLTPIGKGISIEVVHSLNNFYSNMFLNFLNFKNYINTYKMIHVDNDIFFFFNTNAKLVLIEVNVQMMRNGTCKVHTQISFTKYIVIKNQKYIEIHYYKILIILWWNRFHNYLIIE